MVALEERDSHPDASTDAQQADLTVIVVSYNTVTLTLEALRTLHATTLHTSFRCVVFDNASSDGSADAIAREFPQVELVRSDENLGFARANNLVAAAAETEWLLLLNPDTEAHEGAIDNLMAFAREHPEAGIWGGRTVFPDGSLNIASCWGQITPWSAFCSAVGLRAAFPKSAIFNPEAYGSWQRDSVRHVDIVTGCFLLIRRQLWNELGGFDERYYMYGEEADLCLRAKTLGWRPMITPDSEIMHIVGASSRKVARRVAMVAKARTTLIRDHWPSLLVPLGIFLMWLWGALRWLGTRPLTIFGKQRDTAQMWSDVWSTRHDWLKGF
jgi:N-acetylglucosaminyl-diphospho-decaprenol L-rhamnosyltransferase